MNYKGKLYSVVKLSKSLRGFKITRFFGEAFTSRQYSPPGVDSSPPPGSRPLVQAIGGDMSNLATTAFLDRVEKIAEQGETRLYSSADGETVAAFIFLKKDGKLLLNGDELGGLIKIAELEAKLNEAIAELQTHTHPSNGSPPSQTFTQFDKSDFENTEVTHG